MESTSVDKEVEVETPKEGEVNENELSDENTPTAQDVECNPSVGSNEAEAFTVFGFTFDTDKQCSTTATKSTASEGEPECVDDTTHIISKNDLSETPISSISTADVEKEGDVCTTEENLVNVIQSEDDNERTQSSFPIEVLSLVLPMLPKSQLLKCRQVSKKWKKVTNEYYQKSTTITFRPVYHHGLDNGFIISNTLNNLQFVQAMQNHTGNPFPKRLVTIIRTNEGVSDSIFWKSTTLLLKSFGRHIWSFAFEWENGGNLIEKCARLRNCLLLLPNLKWLSIGTVFVDKGKPVEPSLLTIFKLNKFLDKHPLPTIQSLSAIELSPAADIPESCVHALLNNNLHVKCLIGQYEKMNTLYNLPQLEEVRMWISVKDSLLLCAPIQVNPPLKKICLQKSGFCMLNYETVFTWLHRFQNTLEELVLCCKWFIMFYKDIIELPKVKKFKLMCSELKSLRYVQGLPSLEYFEVDSLYISTLNDRLIANLETVAYQGNCWKVHENLKTIVLRGKPRYGSGREVILRYDRTTYDQRYKLWQSQQVNAAEDDDVATQVLEERDLDMGWILGEEIKECHSVETESEEDQYEESISDEEKNGGDQHEESSSEEEEGLEEYRKLTRVEKENGVEKLANEEEVENTSDDAALTKPEDSSPVPNVTGVEERGKSHEATQSSYDDDLQYLDTQLIFGEEQCTAAETEKRGEDFEEYIPHMEDKVEEYKGSTPVENEKGVEKSVTEMGVNEEVAKELANENGIDKRPSDEVVNTLANEDEIKHLLFDEVVEKVANEDEVEELPSDEVVDKVADKEGIEKIEKSCAVPVVIGVEDLEKSDEVTQSMDGIDLENLDTQLILEEEFAQSIAAEKELGEPTLIVTDKVGDDGESTQAETENGEEEQHESLAVLEDENEEYRESTPAVEEKGGDEFIESPAGMESKVEEEYKSTVAEKDNGCEEGDDSFAALTHKDEEYRESTPAEKQNGGREIEESSAALNEEFGKPANKDGVEMIAIIADAVTLVHEKGVEMPVNQEGTQVKRDNGIQQFELENHNKVEESDPVSTDIEIEAPEESTTVLTAEENREKEISVMNEVMTEEPEKRSTVVELLQVVVDDVEKKTEIDGLLTKLGVDDTQESTPIGDTKGAEEEVESVYQEEPVSTPAKP